LTIDNIDVKATLKRVQVLLDEEPNLSPALRSTLEVLILVVQLMVGRLSLSSRNSSKPPSTDRFPTSKKPKEGEAKKTGGQKGRVGTTLKKVENPDRIENLPVDRRALPEGEYTEVGYESRQVFNIEIQRVVTEYRAQILEDALGQRFTAAFPLEVSKAVQYGNGVKAQAVYQSQYQLIPYNRVQEYFRDQLQLPISQGSVFNFNQQAHAALEQFELTLINRLLTSRVLHSDETGININGTNHWLHCVSNPQWTLFYAHAKRGMDAVVSKEVLPHFEGYLQHAERQIDQIRRRVLEGETIPHEEKVFSIFQPHTEWVQKGKAGVPVELGLKVCVLEDQHGFILHHQVMQKTTDEQVAVAMTQKANERFQGLSSVSYDKGFHSPANQTELQSHVDRVILPKKGRLSAIDRERQSDPIFVRLRKRHSAVESAINALEAHGLDFCPDHGIEGFHRYVGLAVLARNIQRLGVILREKEARARRGPYKKAA